MARIVDSRFQGLDRVIGAWERGGVVIDPGPASTAGTVLDALEGVEVRAILLTHIHLDHAGGTGTVLARHPEAQVFVHEVGAPHMIDPSRLLESAARLYGADRMRPLWGETLPVDRDRVTALSGGECIEGFDVIHTPGHASHHVTYVDREEGSAYVGDVAGVRIPPAGRTLMPTPPPEIDVDAWLDSLERLRERRPERLRLTHYGEIDGPDAATAQLELAGESLRRAAEWAREGDRAGFLARIGAEVADQPDDEEERMRAAMPLEQVWLGLERYWRKRAEREASRGR